MKIGTALGLLSPKYWLDVAIQADQLGFHSLWIPDHLIFPLHMSGSPFSGADHPPIPPQTQLFDVFSYLSFIAAKTNRIRLGTNVYLLGLRHPFIAARAVQTLDILSQGRADVGVGAGWLREEWDVVGMSPKNRGKRFDEALTICKRLWTEQVISHQGEFYQFDDVMFEPKPIQRPHPPVYIGGESAAALKRVVRLGDGWYGIGHTVDSVRPVLKRLRELCDSEERDFNKLTLITVGEIKTADDVKRWQDTGIHQVIVKPWEQGRDALVGLTRFAEMFF